MCGRTRAPVVLRMCCGRRPIFSASLFAPGRAGSGRSVGFTNTRGGAHTASSHVTGTRRSSASGSGSRRRSPSACPHSANDGARPVGTCGSCTAENGTRLRTPPQDAPPTRHRRVSSLPGSTAVGTGDGRMPRAQACRPVRRVSRPANVPSAPGRPPKRHPSPPPVWGPFWRWPPLHARLREPHRLTTLSHEKKGPWPGRPAQANAYRYPGGGGGDGSPSARPPPPHQKIVPPEKK